MTIHDMQNLNRVTMGYISSIITPGMTLIEVRDLCERFMLSHGADSFGIGMWVPLSFLAIKQQFRCLEGIARLTVQ